MRKWKPSKTKINEFKEQMQKIEIYCKENNISKSSNSDSYYFKINGQKMLFIYTLLKQDLSKYIKNY